MIRAPATDRRGQPWSDAEFADEVPTTHVQRAGSRREEPARSPRSVANWRTGASLPEDIDLISRALFGPTDRHAEARAARFGRARPDPAGPHFTPAVETLAIDAADLSDESAAAAPTQQQMRIGGPSSLSATCDRHPAR